MNTKNVIAITAYNKPDLLFLNLEHFCQDPTVFDYKILVFTEKGFNLEEVDVVEWYKKKYPKLEIQLIVRDKHLTCPLVGFHNILTSYLLAANQAKDFVVITEEDILPSFDYLKFNKECYNKYLSRSERIFCVAHKRRPETEKPGDPTVLIGDYQCTSPSCVSVKAINKYMKPFLLNPDLFNNPISFYEKMFPNSRIAPNDHCHHDGAIERIMEHFQLFSLKPDQARSMHVGLSGIFCGGNSPKGSLQERVSQWRELIKDGNRLRSLSNRPEDMVVINPDTPKWRDLFLDIDRNLALSSSWWYDTKNEFKEICIKEGFHKS